MVSKTKMEKDSTPQEIKYENLMKQKLEPYVNRITQLQTSITKKDIEASILRLAVERLLTKKSELEKGKSSKGKGPKSKQSSGRRK